MKSRIANTKLLLSSLLILSYAMATAQPSQKEVLDEDKKVLDVLNTNKSNGLELAISNFNSVSDQANLSTKAKVTATLSRAYELNANFVRALEYRLKAIDMYEQLGNKRELMISYNAWEEFFITLAILIKP